MLHMHLKANNKKFCSCLLFQKWSTREYRQKFPKMKNNFLPELFKDFVNFFSVTLNIALSAQKVESIYVLKQALLP